MEQQYFVNVLQILDAATERGAWKGGEIESIAMLRKQTMSIFVAIFKKNYKVSF